MPRPPSVKGRRKRIHNIEGNVITVANGLEIPIEYIVTQIDESSMSFVITGKYNEEPFSEAMTFRKSAESSDD